MCIRQCSKYSRTLPPCSLSVAPVYIPAADYVGKPTCRWFHIRHYVSHAPLVPAFKRSRTEFVVRSSGELDGLQWRHKRQASGVPSDLLDANPEEAGGGKSPEPLDCSGGRAAALHIFGLNTPSFIGQSHLSCLCRACLAYRSLKRLYVKHAALLVLLHTCAHCSTKIA